MKNEEPKINPQEPIVTGKKRELDENNFDEEKVVGAFAPGVALQSHAQEEALWITFSQSHAHEEEDSITFFLEPQDLVF